ncbi:fumarate/nitrate reduction transcriptional regulator Fnr [Comamonadaceae bacterium M7527]|nr:fumarate/nitrate reduction transcriptional regulator Fnr [Comamonadaceae bacterium M7527]
MSIIGKSTTTVACSSCNLRDLCMPVGLSNAELEHIDRVVSTRRRISKGQPLFSAGQAFNAMFAVRSGFFKTLITAPDGREQVTGFQMAGEILGMDGIVNAQHSCDAVALEDAEVCVMPYDNMESISRDFPSLQHHIHRVMSRELVRDQGMMLMLGSMRAEERLAAFLVNLTQRLTARGFSASEMVLRMTREEIGSYLGMKLETVSRTFSKFVDEALIEVKQRHIKIVNMDGLRALAAPEARAI